MEPTLRVRCGMIEGRGRGALRQPVTLQYVAGEGLFEVGEYLDGKCGTAGDARPQTARRPRRGLRCHAEQCRIHRRHSFEDRDAVALDHLEHLVRVESGDERQHGTGQNRGIQPEDQAEDVEERQAAHHHVVRTGLDEGTDEDVGIAAQVGVSEHRPLRLAGGSGGVQDDRDVVVTAVHGGVLSG